MPRLIELWLVLVAIVFLFPLFLCISFAVKLSSPGPIFYQSLRMGIGGKEFRLFKFRSMTYSRESSDKPITVQNDNRITSIGRILRRYKLDELPQLLNILKGEMSIVGPRPHALEAKAANRLYHEAVDGYFARHKVKPGMTGWAQVNGCRGETSEKELMAERVRYDLEYIDNWSLWFDVKILALTFAAVLFPKNAY